MSNRPGGLPGSTGQLPFTCPPPASASHPSRQPHTGPGCCSAHLLVIRPAWGGQHQGREFWGGSGARWAVLPAALSSVKVGPQLEQDPSCAAHLPAQEEVSWQKICPPGHQPLDPRAGLSVSRGKPLRGIGCWGAPSRPLLTEKRNARQDLSFLGPPAQPHPWQ